MLMPCPERLFSLSQLEQSARTWGREKQELNNQLMELEHGFRHLPSPVPRDFQVVSDMPANYQGLTHTPLTLALTHLASIGALVLILENNHPAAFSQKLMPETGNLQGTDRGHLEGIRNTSGNVSTTNFRVCISL